MLFRSKPRHCVVAKPDSPADIPPCFRNTMLTEQSILDALKAVKYPGYSRDIISFGLVKHVAVNNGAVNVRLELTSPNPDAARILKAECENVLRGQPGVTHVFVELKQPAGPAPGAAPAAGGNAFANQNKVPGIKRIVAIASGKGGVGKSTCSVNLACALNHLGARVGLLDCDIYGPRDRKSTRLNSSHIPLSRMPSSA